MIVLKRLKILSLFYISTLQKKKEAQSNHKVNSTYKEIDHRFSQLHFQVICESLSTGIICLLTPLKQDFSRILPQSLRDGTHLL